MPWQPAFFFIKKTVNWFACRERRNEALNITKLRAPINGSSREERSEKKTKLKSDFIFDQSTIGCFNTFLLFMRSQNWFFSISTTQLFDELDFWISDSGNRLITPAKTLRCENSFLVIDLISYCCGIDNESRAKITLQQFYIPSSLLCPFTQEFKNQQRTAEKMFPTFHDVGGSMEGERNETRNIFPTDASKQHCSPSIELERNADSSHTYGQTSINFHFTEQQSCLPVANLILTSTLYLTSTLRLTFDFYGTFMWPPFYCCRRNLRSQGNIIGSHQKSVYFYDKFS